MDRKSSGRWRTYWKETVLGWTQRNWEFTTFLMSQRPIHPKLRPCCKLTLWVCSELPWQRRRTECKKRLDWTWPRVIFSSTVRFRCSWVITRMRLLSLPKFLWNTGKSVWIATENIFREKWHKLLQTHASHWTRVTIQLSNTSTTVFFQVITMRQHALWRPLDKPRLRKQSSLCN